MTRLLNFTNAGGVTNQSIPIVLPVHSNDKDRLIDCSSICLRYNNKPIAIMRDPEFYEHRKEERCSRQFGTSNTGHPYVKVNKLQCTLFYVCYVTLNKSLNKKYATLSFVNFSTV